MFRILNLICFLFVFTYDVLASPQDDYVSAYTFYQKMKFQSSIEKAEKALTANPDVGLKIKTLQLLGINHYLMGEKGKAAQRFQEGILLDPQLPLDKSLVVEEELMAFFEGIRAITKDTKALQKPPIDAPKKPDTPPPSQGSHKRSLLKVITNVPSLVFIDGIFSGQSGESIDTDPGKTQLQIQSEGYRTRTIPLDLKKGKETRVKIDLVKETDEKKTGGKETGGKEALKKTKKKKTKRSLHKEFEDDLTSDPNYLKEDQVLPKEPSALEPPSKHSAAWNLLPFGIGQFRNGDPLLGGVFMTLQGSLLYQYQNQTTLKNRSKQKSNNLFQYPATPGSYTDDEVDRIDQYDKEAADAGAKARTALFAFGVVYAASVAEAFTTHATLPLSVSFNVIPVTKSYNLVASYVLP